VIFTVLHPLGTLPVAAAYRDVSPPPPRQLEWTYVSWFAPSVADTAHAAPRGGLYVRDALARAVTARAAALDAGGPPRAHFYAGAMALLDGSGGQDIDLARVERTAARMAELFAAGRFIAAAR
jgi:hypothetical protein